MSRAQLRSIVMPDRRDLIRRAVSFNTPSAFASAPSRDGDALFCTKKLAIVLVGLPARGKSHIARCLERYLNWLGFPCTTFSITAYRLRCVGTQNASFFDSTNHEAFRVRAGLAQQCLSDMRNWFEHGGQVGIYDATNVTRAQRKVARDMLESGGIRVLFLESVCEDKTILARIRDASVVTNDYKDMTRAAAEADFAMRVRMHERDMEKVDVSEKCSFIRVVDIGRQMDMHDIRGHLQAKLVSFLLNTHSEPRRIFLSRHGESLWNVSGQLGGDPSLTSHGRAYALALAQFVSDECKSPAVWTSQLRRTRQTVEHINAVSKCWRALNEINAGICEGLTYAEVAVQYPEVAKARKADKLNYRYPQGESYIDVINRLEPAILELERHRGDVLVVAHNAVIRAIYAYYTGRSRHECPNLDIPLHTVFRLSTRPYGVEEHRFNLAVHAKYENKTPESGNSDGS